MDKFQARISFLASEMQYWLYLHPEVVRETDADKRTAAFEAFLTTHLNDHGLALLRDDD